MNNTSNTSSDIKYLYIKYTLKVCLKYLVPVNVKIFNMGKILHHAA